MLVNRVVIENFCGGGSKVDVEIKSSITILIGENGTGKRNFMNHVNASYPNKAFLVDCPENGIHPRCLKSEVVDIFCAQANRGYQIFCKTYSPYLLDYFQPMQVLLFVKKEGVRRVLPLDQCGIESWIGEFSLGELYYNMGDEELARRYDKLQGTCV